MASFDAPGVQPFGLIDEEGLFETSGFWAGVENEVGYYLGETSNKVRNDLASWQGPARTKFLRWWQGADDVDARDGAKGDMHVLLRMVDQMIETINAFNRAAAAVNAELIRANVLIANNTVSPSSQFTLETAPLYGAPATFSIVRGTMYPQDYPTSYLELEPRSFPFPYGSEYVPAWFDAANRHAHEAVHLLDTAQRSCIDRLGAVRALGHQVHQLRATNPSLGSWM